MYNQGRTQQPRQIEMQRYPQQTPNRSNPPTYTDPKKYQEPLATTERQVVKEQPPSYTNYVLHIVVFTLAMALNIGVWAIDYFVVQIQASYYYSKDAKISTYIDAATTPASVSAMFSSSSNGINSALSVSMSLVYSWLLWKLPLIVFSYHLVSKQQGKGLRIGTVVTLLLVLLAVDILLTVFVPDFFAQYIFFSIYIVFALVVSVVNCQDKATAAKNTLIPLLIIATIYFIYGWLLPSLYKVYYNNLSIYSAIFLIIYGYPVVDILLYSLTLVLGNKIDNWIKEFFSTIHFLLLGYGVGMILLIGYTEVQFYYLIAYFIFRNIFVNYIMRQWQKVVWNPPALPGWIMAYYLSFALNFLPIIGVGQIIVSKSFSSSMFATASQLLYSLSNPLYPQPTPLSNASSSAFTTNLTLKGNVVFVAAAIIWIAITFTQKYHLNKPSGYDFFYYLFGIHLFYMGITCSLQIPFLYQHSSFG